MAAHRGEQAADRERFHPPGVIPLEVWDLVTSDGLLFELSEQPCFVRALLETLGALHRGEARPGTARGGLAVARGFAGLVVGGGGLLRPGVAGALRQHSSEVDCPWSRLVLDPDPVFMAGAGGRTLAARWCTCPLIIDIGQTAVKLMCAEERALVGRPWPALPARNPLSPAGQPGQRQALRSFVTDAVRSFLRQGQVPRPDGVVLALPCELDDQGVPGPCSYDGLEGDGPFAGAVLAEAGLADLPCLLLNDAELAAVSAQARWGNSLPPRTLVLTLGFGVGAALLVKEDADDR